MSAAITPHPTGRLDRLKAELRLIDTSVVTTPEVIELCERVLPDATADEMVAALRQVAAKQLREAKRLRTFAAERRRQRGGAA